MGRREELARLGAGGSATGTTSENESLRRKSPSQNNITKDTEVRPRRGRQNGWSSVDRENRGHNVEPSSIERLGRGRNRKSSKAGFSLDDIPAYVYFIVAVIILAIIVTVICINNPVMVAEIGGNIKRFMIVSAVILGITLVLWGILMAFTGRGMPGVIKAVALIVVLGLVILTKFVPAVGIFLFLLGIFFLLIKSLIGF